MKTRRQPRPEDELSERQLERIGRALTELRTVHRRRIRDSRIDLVAVRLDSTGEVRDVLHIEAIRRFP